MSKQNNSGPEKKREEGHGKITEFIDTDMTSSDIYKDLKNSFITGQKPLQDKLSILDLPKLHSLTDNEKFHLLSVFFGSHDQKTDEIYFDRANNTITPTGINYINQLLNDSIDYYQNYLLRNIGPSFTQKRNRKKLNPPKISIRNTKDMLDFIDATTSEKNSKPDRQIDCSLLKIAICLHEYKEYEKEFSQAESKFKEIKEKYFFPHFYDDKGSSIDYDIYKKCFDQPGDCDYVILQTNCQQSSKATIFFKSSWRIKDPEKIVLKMISNREYSSIDAIHDIYGIRNEVNSRKDALFLLEYLWINVFKKDGEIIDKKMFVIDTRQEPEDQIDASIAFLNNNIHDLDPDFYTYMTGRFEIEKNKFKEIGSKQDPKKKSKSNKNYRDIKIKGKLGGKKIEAQINMVNSKNERGYSHHLLYDAKIKIYALVRLQSYISETLIKRYIKEAIDKNIIEEKDSPKTPELLLLGGYKGNADKITPLEKNIVIQKIFDDIYKVEKAFVKLDLPGKQHDIIYTTIDHRNAYHHDDNYKKIYPNGAQINFDGERTKRKI